MAAEYRKKNHSPQLKRPPVTPITDGQGPFSMPGKDVMPVKSYKDRNGKTKYYAAFYYSDYTGQRKKKKKEGFTTAAAAKQFEKDFTDQHSGSSDILFRNLVENYLADCRQRQKPTTLLSKTNRIDHYVLPFFSDLPVSEITPLHVRKWQNEILQKGYKPGTMRMIHASLAAVLNFAVKYYGLKQNPATLAGSIGTLKQLHKIQFYTLDQFKKFLPCVSDKFRVAFKILFFTGLRIGELLALTVGDFDAAAGTLTVNKSYSSELGITQTPKTTKSNRVVTLPPFLVSDIEDYLFFKFFEPQPGERLFYWLYKSALSAESKNAATLAGLPQIRLHDFRHSHASLLIDLDFPPLVISERLGHESVKTTLEIYSHLYPDRAATVAEKLQALKF